VGRDGTETVWEGDLDEDDFSADDLHAFWDRHPPFDSQSLSASCEAELQPYTVLGASVSEMIAIDEGCIWSNRKVHAQMRKEIKRLHKAADQAMIALDMITTVMWKKSDDSPYTPLPNGTLLYEEKEREMGKVEAFRHGLNTMSRLPLKDAPLSMPQPLRDYEDSFYNKKDARSRTTPERKKGDI
jgi:hypothetical protein